MEAIAETEGGVLVHILVSPRASRARIGPVHDGRIKVSVTAPPVEGAANDAVIELFAEALGRRRAEVAVTQGRSSRRKTVRITGATRAQLEEVIA